MKKQKYAYNKDLRRPQMELPARLARVNPICLDILYKRGFTTAEEMEQILFPSLADSLLQLPPLLDTDKAVRVLKEAKRDRRVVTVYHDYDVDGVTAAAICLVCLRNLGFRVHNYCNDRALDGFGICPNGVDALMKTYPDTGLIITVDNGISGFEGILRARELGLQVIVTDHHECDGSLPLADAVIDHKRLDEPGNQDRNACGAGVIWRVMLALYQDLNLNVQPVMNTLDFVALGTIADIVPVLGLNRALVSEGLKYINRHPRPFFRVVRDVLNLTGVDSETIGFKLAPMINAVSRMGFVVAPLVEMLVSEDEWMLDQGIRRLQEINQSRKDETQLELDLVHDLVPPDYDGSILIIRDERLQEGIVGIVASHLKEEYNIPTAVFARDRNGNWKGSCRSNNVFHLKNALDQCAGYLLNYGGHAKGAGLTVRADDFEEFEKQFRALSDRAAAEFPEPEKIVIDLVVNAADLTEKTVRELGILEPFGEGFRKPVLGLVASGIVQTQYIGHDEQHVKYIDSTGLAVIQWNKADRAKLRKSPPVKFVGYPCLNHFRGNTFVQFIAD